MSKQEFGIVGLGKMGANLALQALEKGIRVVGYELKGAPPRRAHRLPFGRRPATERREGICRIAS